MYFIGIDLGASFIKSAVLDTKSNRIENVYQTEFSNEASASFELTVKTVIAHIRKQINKKKKIDGIVFCSQMHGMVLLDKKYNPITNFISWKNECPSVDWLNLKSKISKSEMFSLGNEIGPSMPLSKLYSLKRNKKLNRNCFFSSFPDYIISKLTKSEPVTDTTIAASSGMLNIKENIWNFNLLKKLKLDSIRFPKIVSHEKIVGYYKYKQFKIPVYTAIGDQQAAILGAGLTSNEISLNIATGSQVTVISSKPKNGHFKVRPYFGNKFLLTITHIPAGRSINSLIKMYSELCLEKNLNKVWTKILKKVDEASVTKLISRPEVDLSFFNSATGQKGSILGLTEENMTLGQVFYSAFVSMANNYFFLSRSLPEIKSYKYIVFSGGLIKKSERLQNLILTKFGLKQRKTLNEQDALYGLLIHSKKYFKLTKVTINYGFF